MARKRLTLPFAAEPDPADLPEGPLETKAMPFGPASRAVSSVTPPPSPAVPAPRPPPISRIAAETAATAALEALAGEVAEARAAGRMVEALPLDAIDTGHLVRDRVSFDGEEFDALVESLRAHGQRAPVEVIDLGPGQNGGPSQGVGQGQQGRDRGQDHGQRSADTAGRGRGTGEGETARRYGLISGWRRLSALRRLHAETGEARFATVLALLRTPESSGAAYVAMVEENEIRAGLSYYERARIAAKAVEAGAFADRGEALRSLYATASRAKRSKIGSFLSLYDALDGSLRFPAAIGERLGLQLAQRLAEDQEAGAALARLLASGENADPAMELTTLARWAEGSHSAPRQKAAAQEILPGLAMTGGAGRIVLTGPSVTPALRERLAEWLRTEG